MIRGILTDIDGVIVGDKLDYNSPYPHPDVIARLKTIHQKGMPVILATGKPHYVIGKIIRDASLDNPHITDGGAIIIDPITNTIVRKHVIDPEPVARLVDSCIKAGMYVEIYTPDRYIIQKSQIRENLTPVHTHILQTEPMIVDDLVAESKKHEVIKVVPIATDETDTKRLFDLCAPFSDQLSVAITTHMIALPHQFGIVTKKGISKKQSAIDATQALGIPLSDYLAIGDSTSDWSFMQLCGYIATVSNGSDELKQHVRDAGDHGHIADKSVDENGMLSILNFFQL
jgi:HAD superfamily hydrolase (TIGR01484 family)